MEPGERADRQGPGAATFSLGCLRGASLGSGVVSKMVITSSETFHSVAISPRGGADKIAPLAPYAAWLKPWRRELQRSGTWLGAFQSRLHAQSPRPCSEAPGSASGKAASSLNPKCLQTPWQPSLGDTHSDRRDTEKERAPVSVASSPGGLHHYRTRGGIGAGNRGSPSPLLPEKLQTSAQNRERSPPHCERTASTASRASLCPCHRAPEDPQWGGDTPSGATGFTSLF